MADYKPFAGLDQETTQLMILTLLSEILNKLPRLDQYDRVTAVLESSSGSTTAVTGTLTGVTAVTGLVNLGSGATARPTDAMPYHAALAAVQGIYDKIGVI
jgi:hypothetical protein